MGQDLGTGGKSKEIILAGGDLGYCATLTGEVSAGVFTSIGYTAKDAGGVLSDKQPTFKEVKVTGLKDPVKRKALDRDVTFKVTILQSTLANIAIATGGVAADATASGFVGGKAQDAAILKWQFLVQNDDDGTKDKKLIIPRGQVMDAVEVPYNDDKETAIAVTIKALEVTDATVVNGGASLVGARYVMSEGSF